MQQNFGYIYLRKHSSYDVHDAVKLGKTKNVIDRDGQYITGEIELGEFIMVIEIYDNILDELEEKLKEYFRSINLWVYKGGGTEFFNKKIIELIIPLFERENINHKVLTTEEIHNLTHTKREHKENIIINKNFKFEITRPYEHQRNVLNMIEQYYEQNDIGKILWGCGLGKALLGIFIIKQLNCKHVVIGVPSNYLQKQMVKEILKLYPNKANIIFIGSETHNGITATTDKKYIKQFIDRQCDTCKFLVTTYHSCFLLVDDDYTFDFKIGDESHHLVGIENDSERRFELFHKIKSKKTLFMTATEKIIDITTNKTKYTMDDENIFGKCIDLKSVCWSIENKKITDYNLVLLKNTEQELELIINKLQINVENKELFLSAFMTLKALEIYQDLTHILLYTNTTYNSDLTKKYIDQILNTGVIMIPKNDIYNKSLHSRNCINIDDEVSEFKKFKYGIISCVYIFGEGFDLPDLNGVCIAENMKSETRIVQYALRPNRLNKMKPNKIAYILVPYVDNDNNESYNKIKNLISQLRNVDDKIEQKIKLKTSNIKLVDDEKNNDNYIEHININDNVNELNIIKLRLKYSKTLYSDFTEEQDEFNYVKILNKKLNLRSKDDYFKSKTSHYNFIEQPEEYFVSRGVWSDWYDFIGVDISKFIPTKQEWKTFCSDKNIKSVDDYHKLCEMYKQLPFEPEYFYKDFTNIFNELQYNKRR